MVTTRSVAVIGPGKMLARRNTAAVAAAAEKLTAAGLALTREQLNDVVVAHFVVAEDCVNTLADRHWLSCVGTRAPAGEVEYAKARYRAALPRAVPVADAADFLGRLPDPSGSDKITREQAAAMLHVLFAGMTGKRRGDEAAMAKLAECADIFGPASNVLGRALKLWPAVPMHPVALALAIKQLRASKTFEPSEAELREALGKIVKECARLERAAVEWLKRLQATDALMFKTDPDAWRAAHAAINNKATIVLLGDATGAYLEALGPLYEAAY